MDETNRVPEVITNQVLKAEVRRFDTYLIVLSTLVGTPISLFILIMTFAKGQYYIIPLALYFLDLFLIMPTRRPFTVTYDLRNGLIQTVSWRGKRSMLISDVVSSRVITNGPSRLGVGGYGIRLQAKDGTRLFMSPNDMRDENESSRVGSGIAAALKNLNVPEQKAGIFGWI